MFERQKEGNWQQELLRYIHKHACGMHRWTENNLNSAGRLPTPFHSECVPIGTGCSWAWNYWYIDKTYAKIYKWLFASLNVAKEVIAVCGSEVQTSGLCGQAHNGDWGVILGQDSCGQHREGTGSIQKHSWHRVGTTLSHSLPDCPAAWLNIFPPSHIWIRNYI